MKKFDYCITDPVQAYTAYHRKNLKNFLMKLFKWNNLPESIDDRFFNDSLLMRGYCVGFKYVDGKVYVTDGALAGLDEYYRPTEFKAANIKFQNVSRKIGTDCSVCFNTDDYSEPYSFVPMIEIYAHRLAELDVSVDTSVVNSRVCIIPVCDDDKEAIRISKLIRDMYAGKPASIAYKASFNGKTGIEFVPIHSKDNLVVTDLADARRNIMSDFYTELGINNLAVDKKAQTNYVEMNSNNEQLAIRKNIFLEPRQRWCEEMNEMFGTNISVEFNPDIIKEVDLNDQSMSETRVDTTA